MDLAPALSTSRITGAPRRLRPSSWLDIRQLERHPVLFEEVWGLRKHLLQQELNSRKYEILGIVRLQHRQAFFGGCESADLVQRLDVIDISFSSRCHQLHRQQEFGRGGGYVEVRFFVDADLLSICTGEESLDPSFSQSSSRPSSSATRAAAIRTSFEGTNTASMSVVAGRAS